MPHLPPEQAMALSDEEFRSSRSPLPSLRRHRTTACTSSAKGSRKVPPVLFSCRRVGDNRDLPRHGDLGRIHHPRAAAIRNSGEGASRRTVACLCTQELGESCRLTTEHHLANALSFGAVQVVAVLDQGAAFWQGRYLAEHGCDAVGKAARQAPAPLAPFRAVRLGLDRGDSAVGTRSGRRVGFHDS